MSYKKAKQELGTTTSSSSRPIPPAPDDFLYDTFERSDRNIIGVNTTEID